MVLLAWLLRLPEQPVRLVWVMNLAIPALPVLLVPQGRPVPQALRVRLALLVLCRLAQQALLLALGLVKLAQLVRLVQVARLVLPVQAAQAVLLVRLAHLVQRVPVLQVLPAQLV